MSEMMRMKHRVLALTSLFHECDKNVANQSLESRFTVDFGHDSHPTMPDWDMTTDIILLLALDSELVEASMDPSVLERSYIMESGEI